MAAVMAAAVTVAVAVVAASLPKGGVQALLVHAPRGLACCRWTCPALRVTTWLPLGADLGSAWWWLTCRRRRHRIVVAAMAMLVAPVPVVQVLLVVPVAQFQFEVVPSVGGGCCR